MNIDLTLDFDVVDGVWMILGLPALSILVFFFAAIPALLFYTQAAFRTHRRKCAARRVANRNTGPLAAVMSLARMSIDASNAALLIAEPSGSERRVSWTIGWQVWGQFLRSV